MAILNGYESSDLFSRTLVLLHPGGMLHSVWLPFIRHWSQGYHIIAPDLYGDNPTSFTTHQLAQDVISLLRQKSSEPAALVGSSLGANVALQIAVSAPDVVRCLVLDSAQAGGEENSATTQLVLGMVTTILRVLPRPVYLWTIMQSFKTYSQADRQAVRQEVNRLGASGFIQAVEATNHHNVRANLAQIRVPVLLTNGRKDPVLSAATILRQSIPQAQSHVWEGGGHSAFMAYPESFAQKVMIFLHEAWKENASEKLT